MNAVDAIRNAVRALAEHPVLELDYADHVFDDDDRMSSAPHGTFIFRRDFEGSASVVQIVTAVEGVPRPASSGFPVEFIPQVVEHLQAIYKGMQQ